MQRELQAAMRPVHAKPVKQRCNSPLFFGVFVSAVSVRVQYVVLSSYMASHVTLH